MDDTRRTVLIVDDEPAIRQLVRRILGRDYIVVEAQNGVEAVAIARSRKPDLILMDIMMPGMDGLTACYNIKQDPVTRDIPVVMVTAVSHELNRKVSENVMGASGYVTKPFVPETLLSVIGRLTPGRNTGPNTAP